MFYSIPASLLFKPKYVAYGCQFTDSRFSTSTAFLGQTSTSFVFNGLISRSKKYEVNSESVVANSGKPEEEEISYRGFSNFDEIALTHPNDQQKDLAGI